jgi:hypothetical protein
MRALRLGLWFPLFSGLSLGLAGLLAGPSVAAAQIALPLAQVDASAIRIDGSLREWSEVRRADVGSGSDGSMSVALGYSDTGLYVIAQVTDDRMIRTSGHGATEDAIIVTLAFPNGRSLRGTELWLYAGESGSSAAAITSGGVGARRQSAVRGAEIVEAPYSAGGAGGYTLEAFIPWSRIPGSARLDEGFGAVRLRDVDELAHPTVEREPNLGTVDARNLGSMLPLRPAGGEAAVMESFLSAQGLSGSLPSHDFHEDVTGDARPERVSIVERFVVVMGGGAAGFSFMAIDVESPADLTQVRLEDLTGDGKAELTLVARQRGTGGSRDLFEVVSFSGSSPAMIFGIETREETPIGTVESRVRVERGRRGRPAGLVVSTVAARGVDAASWRMAPASDVEAVLLPWGPVRERTYRWDGTRFARESERENPDYVDPATVAASSSGGSSSGSSGASSGSGASASSGSTPSAPGLDALIAAWRTQAGIARTARPRFDLTANLAGDATTERLLVFGTRLVVVGTAFREGTGWFEYGIPAATEGDLLDVSAADLTSEGRAEVLFRIRQNIGDVRREVVVIHHFTPEGFPMLMTREVAREQAGNRIENEIVTTGGRLEIRPGTARGWTQATWPFAESTGPSPDGVEPLLLPWRDRAVRFRHERGRLVPGAT